MKNFKKGYSALLILISVIVLSVLLCIIGVAVYAGSNIDFSVDEALFAAVKSGNVTKFYYDASGGYGSDVGKYIPIEFEKLSGADEVREWYSYSEISQHLKNAFIAAEDRDFFHHHGVNLKRTLAAVANFLTHSGNGFGASTITQQVIKNISGDNERTAKRKLNEIMRAYHLEYKHSKEEIFEVYMNIVPMGENVAGVGLASERYFGKEPSSLTLSEAAALVGITNAPYRYNPYTNYDACIAKRNVILGAMLECGYISDNEYNIASKESLILKGKSNTHSNVNSWFVETVCDELCRDLMSTYGYTYEAARVLVTNGGLSVYTTIDPEIQAVLDDYFVNTDNFPVGISEGEEFSMVITDSQSADLRAIVGAVGKKSGNRLLNYATVPRTPGSVLKPLALYAPLVNSKRITWSTVFDDVPIEFYENSDGSLRAFPRNSPNVYDGLTTVSDALAHSKNTVAVRLYNMLGAEEIYEHLTGAYSFELVKKAKNKDGKAISDMSVSPLALGQLSYGIPLRSLTEAYTVFSRYGELSRGRSYSACYDGEGNTLIEKKADSKRIYTVQCAELMIQMLMRVTDVGTASKITLKNICDVAGKTGTSGGSKDKLFVGFTPYYTAGIWNGYHDSSRAVSGGTHLRVWDDVMKNVHNIKMGREENISRFSTEELVYMPYCKDSGKLYSPECLLDPRANRLEYGYFMKGTTPKEHCDVHVICKRFSYEDEGTENSLKIALLDVKRDFPIQIYVSDELYVYKRREESEYE